MATVTPEPDNKFQAPKIDVDEAEGRIKESSLNKVLKLIEDHPDRTLEVIRGWLH